MFDWTRLTQDPSDKHVVAPFQAFLKSLVRFYGASRNDFLRDYFRAARVLDIGAGEHDPSCYNEERWEHGIISKVAAYAAGIEINKELCEHYNQKGFHFRCVDATSQTDLGERFDLVFIGDVIEHVDNPVALLQFARRHIAPGKRILVSTPNPYYFATPGSRTRRKNRPFFIANFEHVNWVTPTNANELARRAGLQLTALYFPSTPWASVRSLKTLVRTAREKLLLALGLIELAHKEFIYEFTA